MNDALDRLRAADPAAPALEPDTHGPEARAILARVLATADLPPRPRRWRRRRRVAIGIAGATVAAAVAALFVVEPAAAYTVDRNADGTLAVSFRSTQLKNPDKLNAELARAGARTVVLRMVPADQCTARLDMDPAFPFRTDLTPQELAAELERFPVSYRVQDESVLITIRPEKIPAGDFLAFGYAFRTDRGGHTTMAVPAVVRTMPSCMAIPTPPQR